MIEYATAAASAWWQPTEWVLRHRRDQPRCFARHTAMWLMRQRGLSYTAIGRYFGYDRTNVLHAVRNVENALETDKCLAAKVRQAASDLQTPQIAAA